MRKAPSGRYEPRGRRFLSRDMVFRPWLPRRGAVRNRQKPQIGPRYRRRGQRARKKARPSGQGAYGRRQDNGQQRRKPRAERPWRAVPAGRPQKKCVKANGGHGRPAASGVRRSRPPRKCGLFPHDSAAPISSAAARLTTTGSRASSLGIASAAPSVTSAHG